MVDLDGTLVHTDLLHESVCSLLRNTPLDIWRLPLWLFGGRALLKRQLAKYTNVDVAGLPFNRELIGWLAQQRAKGRVLVLCTASDETWATKVSDQLNLFDYIIASDGVTNLSGPRKADALVERFGQAGFDYAGNSGDDVAVWKQARRAIVVNATHSVRKRASSFDVERTFPKRAVGLSAWRRVLRLHQWLKNILLAVPAVAAHQVTDLHTWMTLLLAFLSFSFCASAVYMLNDLVDLESDRHHPRKATRPFAAGVVPVWQGFLLPPFLLVASAALAGQVGGAFVLWILVYFTATCAYSLVLKRLVLIDCLTLALLYTIRIIAGASATVIELSFWLLAFSCFLFLSLAFAKRYAELRLMSHSGLQQACGRAYYVSDAQVIQTLGITSGYAAVVVLALYLNSDTVLQLYPARAFLWAVLPIMVFWVSWMWIQAHRGQLQEDAVVFAFTDRVSLLAGSAIGIAMAVGSVGLPW